MFLSSLHDGLAADHCWAAASKEVHRLVPVHVRGPVVCCSPSHHYMDAWGSLDNQVAEDTGPALRAIAACSSPSLGLGPPGPCTLPVPDRPLAGNGVGAGVGRDYCSVLTDPLGHSTTTELTSRLAAALARLAWGGGQTQQNVLEAGLRLVRASHLRSHGRVDRHGPSLDCSWARIRLFANAAGRSSSSC